MATPLKNPPALYALAEEYREAAAVLAEFDVDEQVINDTLEGLSFPVEQKSFNLLRFCYNLQTLIDGAKEAEKRIYDRRKMWEARVERIKRYIEACLRIAGIKKIESPEHTIMLKKRKARVIVDNSASVPAQFWRFPDPPPPEVDKNAVYDALKEWAAKPEAERGESPVPGAHLEEFDSLEIR